MEKYRMQEIEYIATSVNITLAESSLEQLIPEPRCKHTEAKNMRSHDHK
jgi:hypothetical protein